MRQVPKGGEVPIAVYLEALKEVAKLTTKLDERGRHLRLLERYFEDKSPFPAAVTASKLTKAYRRLMPVAQAPWASLIVSSVLDRLEISGIQDENKDLATAVWAAWQANQMDSESKLANAAGLMAGRVFAGCWPDGPDEQPQVWLDPADQTIIRYAEGSRRIRRSGLRRWQDEDSGRPAATLYLPDGIYKFQGDKNGSQVAGNVSWEKREVFDDETGDPEPWPVPNRYNVVPVVEIAFNRRLKAGSWGHARGEYEHVLGLIDRINLLTFLGLIVAFYMGFPLRGVIGDKILRDDDGNVIAPFDANADSVFQLEDPNAKLAEFQAADRNNLAIYPELAQLAAITNTPRHYFPLAQAMANLSADAIRADEGGLNAKVVNHKASSGEGWLELARLIALMLDETKPLSPGAKLGWMDHQSRSMAERADAAVKLNGIMPWQWIALNLLNQNQDDLSQLEAMRAGDALSQLIAAAKNGGATGGGAGGGDGEGGGGGAGGVRGNEPRVRTTPEPRV